MANGLTKIYDASPEDLYDFLDELKFQNTFNAENNWSRYAGLLIGSHGIGKTASVIDFPLIEIEKLNTKIARKHIKHFKFIYTTFDGSVEKQSLEQLQNAGIDKETIDWIMGDIYKKPITKVIIVDQSAIIVPEDISGLPSSSSDVTKLLELRKVADILQIDPKVINKKLGAIISKYSKENEETTEAGARYTTKFDFTEWEKQIHDSIAEEEIQHVILLLDDITRSANNNPGVLNVLMPILQQGSVGLRPLPKNCSVVLTSNFDYDETTGDTNYVVNLDSAQKDRVFTRIVKFNFDDWKLYAERNNVHEVIIAFAYYNMDLIRQNKISPRRLTQLGQSLYNKYKHSQVFVSDNVSENEELYKTLTFHLGDNRDGSAHAKILSHFISFIQNVSKDTNNFVEMFLKTGWKKETREIIENFIKKGESVKVSICVHKLQDIIGKQIIKEERLKDFSDLFNDEIIPSYLRWTILKSQKDAEKMYDVFMDTRNPETKKLQEQLHKIVLNSAKSVGKMRESIEDAAQKRLEKAHEEKFKE